MEEGSLTKTKKFIKSDTTIPFLIFLSISLCAYLIYTFFIKAPAPKPLNVAFEGSIYPGSTTKNQLESKLGDPVKKEESDGSQNYFYSTENKYRSDEIKITNDVVSLIKEQVLANEKGNLSQYKEKYGTGEAVLYGQHSTFAPGYFWGSKGLMVFANKNDGTIVEIWYFAPTSKDDFLSKNPGLSENENQGVEQFTKF